MKNKISKLLQGGIAGLVAGILALVTLFSSIIFLIVYTIWILISNYGYCTLPFAQECWNPDKIYYSDPIRDDEILSTARHMVKVRTNLGSKGVSNYNLYYNKVPVYDAEDVQKVDSKSYMKNGKKKEGATTDSVNDASKDSTTDTKTDSSAQDNTGNKNDNSSNGDNSSGSSSTNPSTETTKNTESAGATGTTGSSGGKYKINEQPPIDDSLRAMIKKVLGRTTSHSLPNIFQTNIDANVESVISAATKEGLDPRFLTSIIVHETGYGTAPGVHKRNNTGGIVCVHPAGIKVTGCSNGMSHFATLDDSIRYQANFLRRLYIDKGHLTVPEVGAIYAPIGASNDPTNLNKNWVPSIGKTLKSMGVTEDIGVPINGIIDFGDFAGGGPTETPFPEESKYKKLQVINLPLDSDKTLYRQVPAKDLKKKAEEKLVKIFGSKLGGIMKEFLPKLEDGSMNEAEIHLRTLIQNDMQATVGLEFLKYETAHALLRAKREMGAPEKGEDDEKNSFITRKSFDPYIVDFGKWVGEVGYGDKMHLTFKQQLKGLMDGLKNLAKFKLDERNTELVKKSNKLAKSLLLTTDFQNKNKLLAEAAQDELIYPFVVYEMQKIPTEKDLTAKNLQKLYDDYVKENNIDEQILSVLSIGHFMKRNSFEEFKKEYEDDFGLFSFGPESAKKAFDKYVSDERAKTEEDDVQEAVNKKYTNTSFWQKVGNQANGLIQAPKNYAKGTYFDMKVKGNTFIRFAIYSKSRDLIEVGSYSRNLCFLTDRYGKEDISKYEQLKSELGSEFGNLIPGNWAKSYKDVGDSNAVKDFCIKVNKAAYGEGKLTWEESQVLDKVRITKAVNFTCVPKPEEILKQEKEEYDRKKKEEEKETNKNNSPAKENDYGKGVLAGEFKDEVSMGPRSPYKVQNAKVYAKLPKSMENLGSDAEAIYEDINKLLEKKGKGQNSIAFVLNEDAPVLTYLGEATKTGGTYSIEWVDMENNAKISMTLSDPDLNCEDYKDSKYLGIATHERKVDMTASAEAYYPSVYEAYAVSERFNLSGLKGTGAGSSSTADTAGAGTSTGDGGITGTPTGKVLSMESTAYIAKCPGCSGITAYGIDARGNPPPKVIAVDPKVIPLGTYVHVEGYGEAIAGDTGGRIKGNIIDVLVGSNAEARQWGRKQNVKVTILAGKPPGYGKPASSTDTSTKDTTKGEDKSKDTTTDDSKDGASGTPTTGNPFGTKGTYDGSPNNVKWEPIKTDVIKGPTNIHPTLAQRLIDLVKAKGKTSITITDGGRTRAQQEDVKRRKPTLAATPGKSKHEAGLAVDVVDQWLKDMRDPELQKYGLHKPVLASKGEDWHIEVIETGTAVGRSNRSNAEVIQILGGLNPDVKVAGGVTSSPAGEFREKSLDLFFSYLNIDYSLDEEWKTKVGDWFTSRTVGTSSVSGDSTTAPGGSRVLDKTAYEGVDFQLPLSPGSNGKLTVSSGFGYRMISGKRDFHEGIDFKGNTDTPIYAATDGVVQAAGVGQGYGNRVRIMTKTAKGDTIYTTYGHLNSISVKQGQQVKRGDHIGGMGNTGHSFGTHLHFDIGFNGYTTDKRVDPGPILGLSSSNVVCQPTASNCPAK